MVRVIVLCERPRQMPADEAVEWLRRASTDLASAPAIRELRLTLLESASPAWASSPDWLIEAEVTHAADPRALVESRAWCELLSDLRLLGMRPEVALADAANATTLRGR